MSGDGDWQDWFDAGMAELEEEQEEENEDGAEPEFYARPRYAYGAKTEEEYRRRYNRDANLFLIAVVGGFFACVCLFGYVVYVLPYMPH